VSYENSRLTICSSEDAIKAYKFFARQELNLESRKFFNRTCLHRVKKCYLGAKIEVSIIVVDHLFFNASPLSTVEQWRT
jgi:hypothetical protein